MPERRQTDHRVRWPWREKKKKLSYRPNGLSYIPPERLQRKKLQAADAKKAGRKAAENGLEVWENPHVGSIARHWRTGWDTGHAEASSRGHSGQTRE